MWKLLPVDKVANICGGEKGHRGAVLEFRTSLDSMTWGGGGHTAESCSEESSVVSWLTLGQS
jgi:hypothetical protein